MQRITVDRQLRIEVHALRADVALQRAAEGHQVGQTHIVAAAGHDLRRGLVGLEQTHGDAHTAVVHGDGIAGQRGVDRVSADCERGGERAARPRERADAVDRRLWRDVLEELRVGRGDRVGAALCAGQLHDLGDHLADIVHRAAQMDGAGGDVERISDVLRGEIHAVHGGGHAGGKAAVCAAERRPAGERDAVAGEVHVKEVAAGIDHVDDRADEAERAGQIGIAGERFGLEAAAGHGGDGAGQAAQIQAEVRAHETQCVGIFQRDRAGDHAVGERHDHAARRLLDGNAVHEPADRALVEGDVRDLNAQRPGDEPRGVQRIARGEHDLLAPGVQVQPVASVGREQVYALNRAARLEGVCGQIDVHVQRAAFPVCRHCDTVVRRAQEEVLNDLLRVLGLVELAEVIRVVLGLQILLERGLIVRDRAEVGKNLRQRAGAVRAADARHDDVVVFDGVHLQDAPLAVDRPDHMDRVEDRVLGRAAVGAHLPLVVNARALRLQVEGDGVGAVAGFLHDGVLHRVLRHDVVREIARVLPVGGLVVLLRDGDNVVRPLGVLSVHGRGVAHEDRTVLEIFLLAHVFQQAGADCFGKHAVRRHNALVVYLLRVVDEADLGLGRAGRDGAIGGLLHYAHADVEIILRRLTGGVAVRPGEQIALAAGGVVLLAAAEQPRQDQRRRERQREHGGAQHVEALAAGTLFGCGCARCGRSRAVLRRRGVGFGFRLMHVVPSFAALRFGSARF